MAQAKHGDTVRVHYTGRLADGSVFDSSEGRDPLEFRLGEQQVIPGFEEAITGMEPGDRQTVTIPPDQAYGHRRDDLVFDVPRSQLPAGLDPEPGQQLQMQQGTHVAVVRVQEVSDDAVKLDANHPLAGEDLTFDVSLVDLR